MSKSKETRQLKTEKTKHNDSSKKLGNGNGNHNGTIASAVPTLDDLNKTYAAARTKKEKDDARKALTLATFNATYESRQKRRS